jgi:hypothetical protein
MHVGGIASWFLFFLWFIRFLRIGAIEDRLFELTPISLFADWRLSLSQNAHVFRTFFDFGELFQNIHHVFYGSFLTTEKAVIGFLGS